DYAVQAAAERREGLIGCRVGFNLVGFDLGHDGGHDAFDDLIVRRGIGSGQHIDVRAEAVAAPERLFVWILLELIDPPEDVLVPLLNRVLLAVIETFEELMIVARQGPIGV
ncbi:MAG: hypothetical protein V3S11_01220, partial [Elusimicrobiota bacterium]